jgi:hypothetical protein
LYEALADSWIKLGLPADTRDSIVRGAFYTTIVRPGLRMISLNMNYCAPENYWLFVNATDPLDQLQWVSFHALHRYELIFFSWSNGYNMQKIMKKKFTLSVIIHHVRV